MGSPGVPIGSVMGREAVLADKRNEMALVINHQGPSSLTSMAVLDNNR